MLRLRLHLNSRYHPSSSPSLSSFRTFSTQHTAVKPQQRQQQQQPQKRTVSTSAYLVGGTLTLACGYLLGSLYPPSALTLLYPSAAPGPLSRESAEGIAEMNRLEKELQILPHIQRLKADRNYYESRPYAQMDEARTVNTLTAGALRAPGRLPLAPLVHALHDDSEAIVTLHVGRGVCGHDGIVHGGLIATLFDESLARTAILNLPGKIGVTAKLEVSYRAPLRADQFIIIKSTLEKKDGRKAYVKAELTDLDGKVHAQANALFIEPKYSFLANKSNIRQALGADGK